MHLLYLHVSMKSNMLYLINLQMRFMCLHFLINRPYIHFLGDIFRFLKITCAHKNELGQEFIKDLLNYPHLNLMNMKICQLLSLILGYIRGCFGEALSRCICRCRLGSFLLDFLAFFFFFCYFPCFLYFLFFILILLFFFFFEYFIYVYVVFYKKNIQSINF